MKLFSNEYKIVDNIFSNPRDVVEFANQQQYSLAEDNPYAVSYTHLTLQTIVLV